MLFSRSRCLSRPLTWIELWFDVPCPSIWNVRHCHVWEFAELCLPLGFGATNGIFTLKTESITSLWFCWNNLWLFRLFLHVIYSGHLPSHRTTPFLETQRCSITILKHGDTRLASVMEDMLASPFNNKKDCRPRAADPQDAAAQTMLRCFLNSRNT